MHIYRKAWIFWRQRKNRLEDRLFTGRLTTHMQQRKLAPTDLLLLTQHTASWCPQTCFQQLATICVKLTIWPEACSEGSASSHRSGLQLWLCTNRLGYQPAPKSLSTISGSSFATSKSSVKRLHLTSVNGFSGISFILHDNFHISCKEL